MQAAPAPPREYAPDAGPSQPSFPVAPAPPLPQVSASAGPDASSPEATHQAEPVAPINIIETVPDAPADGHQTDYHTEDDTKHSDDESSASVAATLLVAPLLVLCSVWAVGPL